MYRTATSTVAVVVALVVAGVAAGGVAALAPAGGGTSAVDDPAAADAGAQTQNETAFVRVVHASPDAPNVDVYFDGERVLSDVPFGTVGEYLQVAPGEHSVRVTVAGNESAVVFDDTVTFEAGQRYSAVALGEVGENVTEPFNVTLFEDATELPEEGNASVRLVHLSPDAPAVDVVVNETGEVIFENVTFGNASGYVTVPAGDYTLDVRPTGEDTTVATFDVSLEGETANSAFAVGMLTVEQEVEKPFDLRVATDLTAEMMEGEEMGTETPTEGNVTVAGGG